jgi:hypothetical protein
MEHLLVWDGGVRQALVHRARFFLSRMSDFCKKNTVVSLHIDEWFPAGNRMFLGRIKFPCHEN